MNQLPPYRLWIGHAGDGADVTQLFDAGVQAVVQLAAEEPPLAAPRELIAVRLPLLDGAGNNRALLTLAVEVVSKLLWLDIPTLVCCGVGLSRAPVIAAAALAVMTRQPIETTLQQVLDHQQADVSPGFWHDVRELFLAPGEGAGTREGDAP
jgi:hypothetical protein